VPSPTIGQTEKLLRDTRLVNDLIHAGMAYYEHYSSVNNSGTIGMQLQARENIDE